VILKVKILANLGSYTVYMMCVSEYLYFMQCVCVWVGVSGGR